MIIVGNNLRFNSKYNLPKLTNDINADKHSKVPLTDAIANKPITTYIRYL